MYEEQQEKKKHTFDAYILLFNTRVFRYILIYYYVLGSIVLNNEKRSFDLYSSKLLLSNTQKDSALYTSSTNTITT